MKIKVLKLKKYEVKYYPLYKNEINVSIFEKIYNDLLLINEESGMNLQYGIFLNPENRDRIYSLLSKMAIVVVYENKKPIGYEYFYIMNSVNNKKLVHTGLIVINKNKGLPLMTFMGNLALSSIYEDIGEYFICGITTVPKILEKLDTFFYQMWPTPTSKNLSKPPKFHRDNLDVLLNEYVKEFFPDAERISVDNRRSVLRLTKKESGFAEYFYELSKSSKLKYNVFCNTWLDYEKEEDLIVIGKCTLSNYIQLILYRAFWAFKGLKNESRPIF